ncbi:Chromosome partition protein Smc [Sulfuracidifex tepidarius]|uniref:Chromosome partition protein Smc n=1 Tax=Sulfuracidifex tepidarius TaxID=1294262 RepID=A0A510DT33_9CREN|nr:hypothetical protein [Sulfuracidifex tepidarius]BBG23318.1 Chromosome partition protein Smc [Sulfuracidifex tepidarius]
MSGERVIDEILKNPELISALAHKVYDKLKDEIVIKKLEENSSAIKALEETVKSLQETVNKHTEAIESLQEAVKKQGEAIASLQETVKSLQETVNKHTEAIESLQEAVKKQGEAIASLQEAVKKQGEAIASLQEAVKKQGEAIASLQEAVKKHSKALLRLMKEQKKLSVEIGSFTSRAGKGLEKTILNIYKKALKLHHVDISKIRHGNVVDEMGLIEKGKSFEIDFYETNDHVYIFEVKNFADEGVIEQILIRRKLLEAKFMKPVKAFVVANYVEREIKNILEKEGVEIIYSYEVK